MLLRSTRAYNIERPQEELYKQNQMETDKSLQKRWLPQPTYLIIIVADLSCKTEISQLRNTAVVINQFKYLPNKHKLKLIKFDIAEFYPPISENLLNKSVKYAKLFTKIEGNAINTIKFGRKSRLFNKDGTWV